MARQTINLDFKANISQAKESLVSLAQAYRQALESGDPGQRGEVQQLIQERSAAMGPGGFDVDAISAQLEKAIALQKEFESSEIKINELKQASLRVEEEARQIQRDKKDLLDEAAQILGKEDGIKITELRQEFALIQKNNEELEKKGKLTEEDRKKAKDLFNILQGYESQLDRQTNKNKEAKKIEEDKSLLLTEQKVKTEQIAKVLETLATDEDSRVQVMAELLRFQIETEESLKRSTKAAERLTEESVKIKKEQKEVASTLASAKDSFAGKAVQAFIYYQALTALRRVARAAVSTLRELDKALTDIAVVTTMSREQSWRLLGTYQEMAKQVGLTTTEVANLSIAFFRQGRSARDALQLTETAAKFAKIAAIDVNDAANFLTAAINGFNLAASEAGRIIDRFAALGAGAAASASEIAIALSKVAPAAASAGVEIDNLMAFVTKGIETTREAPENIGTAFKTIFARMRELTDIGKVMEDGMDVNRVETALASVGVALRDANGQFRNLDQVLIDVGKKWDTIDRNSQAYLATTLAGTRQQTRLIALFEDFDRTLELIEISQGSAGVAAIQHTEYMQGMEAATTRLKTSFQELITAFVNSNQVIFVINSLNSAMEFLNTGVGRTIITMTTMLALWKVAITQGTRLNGVLVATQGIFGKKGLLMSWANLNKGIGKAVRSTQFYQKQVAALNITKAKTITIAQRKIITLYGSKQAQDKLAAATILSAKANLVQTFSMKLLTASIKKGIIAMKTFITTLMFSPMGLLIAVAALAVGAKKLWDSGIFKPPVARAAQRFEELQDKLKDLNTEIRKLRSEGSKLSKTLNEFERLSRITFLSPQEIARLSDLETQLQLDLETDLSGDALIDQARREIKKINEELQVAVNEQRQEIHDFFRKNPLANFNDLAKSEHLSADAKKNLTAVGIDYAVSFMDGFESMTPEVQALIRRMIEDNLGDTIDQIRSGENAAGRALAEGALKIQTFDWGTAYGSMNTFEMLVKAGEEAGDAYQRALTEGLDPSVSFAEFQRVFNQQLQTTTGSLIGGPIADYGPQLAQAYLDLSTKPFAEAQQTIADLFKGLSGVELQDALNAFRTSFPELETLLSLDKEQAINIQASGGLAALRDLTKFQNLASDIFTTKGDDGIDIFDQTGADAFIKQIFDNLITSDPSQRALLGSQLMQQVLAGMTTVPKEDRMRVANAITDFLIPDSIDNLINAAFRTSDDLNRLFDLSGKGFNISAEDLEFLTNRYPNAIQDILNGTADLSALQAETTAGLLAELDAREEAIVANALVLQQQGLMTDGQMSIVNAQLQSIQIARNQLTTSRQLTDDIKARFEAERESLKAQRSAIDEAKKLRDLQQKAREASALSTQATRIGAVGTIEARFNQEQLQAQITQMNRDLEERIQIAKIEAQDRILEETQRRLLLKAQEENTTALYSLADVFNRFTGEGGSLQNLRPRLAGGGSIPGGGLPNELPALADQ